MSAPARSLVFGCRPAARRPSGARGAGAGRLFRCGPLQSCEFLCARRQTGDGGIELRARKIARTERSRCRSEPAICALLRAFAAPKRAAPSIVLREPQVPSLLAWIGIAGLIIVGACVLAGRSSARHRRLRHAGILLGVCMVGMTVCNGIALWPKLHAGVVIAAATPVRVSPVPMGDALFTLAEGETVKLAAEHEGFTLIRTRSGRSGWVSKANVAPIVP